MFFFNFSLRTLCRALTIIANNTKINKQQIFSLSFLISFTSNLDTDEQKKLASIVQKYFGKFLNLKTSISEEESNKFMLVLHFF